jgi:hypothetical protein
LSAVVSASSLALTEQGRRPIHAREERPERAGSYEPPARIAALESLVAGALQDFEGVIGESLQLPSSDDFVPDGGRRAPPPPKSDKGTWCEAADFAYASQSDGSAHASDRPILARDLREAAEAARTTLSRARQQQCVASEEAQSTAEGYDVHRRPLPFVDGPRGQALPPTPVRPATEEAPLPWDDSIEASRHLERLHRRLMSLDDAAAALEARLEADSMNAQMPEAERLRALRGVREERSGFVDRRMLLEDARRLIAAQ